MALALTGALATMLALTEVLAIATAAIAVYLAATAHSAMALTATAVHPAVSLHAHQALAVHSALTVAVEVSEVTVAATSATEDKTEII